MDFNWIIHAAFLDERHPLCTPIEYVGGVPEAADLENGTKLGVRVTRCELHCHDVLQFG
jgi:hypothetical protein